MTERTKCAQLMSAASYTATQKHSCYNQSDRQRTSFRDVIFFVT